MNLYVQSICFKSVLLQVTQVLKHITLGAYILKKLQYNVSFVVVKAIDHKKNIICSCFVGLTPVLIFAVCEIMFCLKAAGF